MGCAVPIFLHVHCLPTPASCHVDARLPPPCHPASCSWFLWKILLTKGAFFRYTRNPLVQSDVPNTRRESRVHEQLETSNTQWWRQRLPLPLKGWERNSRPAASSHNPINHTTVITHSHPKATQVTAAQVCPERSVASSSVSRDRLRDHPPEINASITVLFLFLGHSHSCAQSLLLTLHSGITPGDIGGWEHQMGI